MHTLIWLAIIIVCMVSPYDTPREYHNQSWLLYFFSNPLPLGGENADAHLFED